ncbi:protein YgfX [Neptunomonas sp.]|uniref:protein YgfX n=1 Tax=Neptunomonas sp. TaxID=1971898 RepID=UPI0035674CF0
MFSPLDIAIKPSSYFRAFYFSCLIIALCAVLYSNISLLFLLFSAALLLVLACLPFGKPQVMRLIWDLDRQSIKLLRADGSWRDGLMIEKIHLLPYLFSFRVITKSGERISIGIFPDSVSGEDLRQLKVALKLGKMALVSKAIHS